VYIETGVHHHTFNLKQGYDYTYWGILLDFFGVYLVMIVTYQTITTF